MECIDVYKLKKLTWLYCIKHALFMLMREQTDLFAKVALVKIFEMDGDHNSVA
uniref:Uncharacterized protein n=1 Tax=Arion vulgaris TaxID=1028688 RepID=A0A0B6Y946_9EUPU